MRTSTFNLECQLRIVGDDQRTHIQAMGSHGSKREHLCARDDNWPAVGQGLCRAARGGAYYETVSLICGEVVAVDVGMDGYHRGIVAL